MKTSAPAQFWTKGKHCWARTWSNLSPVSWGSAAKVSVDLLLNRRITCGKVKSQSQHSFGYPAFLWAVKEAQCHCTVSHKASFSQRLLSLMREPRDSTAVCNFPHSNHWKSSFHSREYTQCPLQMLTVTRHRRQEANSQIWKFEFTTYGSDCLRKEEDSGKIALKSGCTYI